MVGRSPGPAFRIDPGKKDQATEWHRLVSRSNCLGKAPDLFGKSMACVLGLAAPVRSRDDWHVIGSRRANWLLLAAALVVIPGVLGTAGAARSSASAPISVPLIAFWNGASWTQQVAPNADGSGTLTAVAAVSPTDAWALGSSGYSASTPSAQWFNTLAEHWNGSSWQQVAMPTPRGASGVNLYGAAAVSASDIWAVGSWADSGPGDGLVPLIEHWDGTAWSLVRSPVLPTPVENHGAQLYGVTAVSASDVWAVGYIGYGSHRSLILHWNGTSWTRVPAPHSGSHSGLSGVATLSPTKVWAVGTFHFIHDKRVFTQPFALRWNGRIWQKMPNIHAGSLLAVGGGNNDIWAVGGHTNGGTGQALIEHWNGRHWKTFSAHAGYPSSIREPLSGIAVLPGDEIWAVGYHQDQHSLQSQTLIEHFDHGAWSGVSSMNPANDDWFAGVAAAAPTAVWAVGTYFPGS